MILRNNRILARLFKGFKCFFNKGIIFVKRCKFFLAIFTKSLS